LPYGLEAYAPIRHLRKEDNSMAEVDDTLTVKVLEFNRDDKRILVSHSRYIDDLKRKADDEVRKTRGQERAETRRNIQQRSAKMEKTTLGELDVFSQLKDQLKAQEDAAKSEAAAAAPAHKVEEPKAEEPKAEAPKVEESKAEEKPAAVKAPAKKADGKPDDLKKIEGIGPKISTFEALAAAKVETLKGILADAGKRYQMHDPTTWPEQASLAAEGKWEELKTLQDELDGGKK